LEAVGYGIAFVVVVASLTVTGCNLQVAFFGIVHDRVNCYWTLMCVMYPTLKIPAHTHTHTHTQHTFTRTHTHTHTLPTLTVGKLMEMHGEGVGAKVDRGYEPPVQKSV